MTADHEVATPLTDRDRISLLYGELAARPDVLRPLGERILAELDIADRLLAGAEVLTS